MVSAARIDVQKANEKYFLKTVSVYEGAVRPHLEYGSQTWASIGIAKTNQQVFDSHSTKCGTQNDNRSNEVHLN